MADKRYESSFLREAVLRGFARQCSDFGGLDAAASSSVPVCAYAGFDATADSLHVGHLIPLMLLRLWQRCGHRPAVVVGGGTTLIGDPSGRDESRLLLQEAEIARNVVSLRRQFERFLDFGSGSGGGAGSGSGSGLCVDNGEWLGTLKYIAFLREVGRHFSVNRMLATESVRRRLEREQPLSFLEFNYMVVQGYDFLEMNRRYGCRVQFGGSDQWGNIVAGIDLVRRLGGGEVYGLTTPLLETASGAKMGKTARGAVWLSATRFSPWHYWQFWRNVEDADVGRFLALFTEIPMAEVSRLASLGGEEVNEAKKVLADEATSLCHGRAAATAARRGAAGVFEGGGDGVSGSLPCLALKRGEFGAGGIRVVELLRRGGLCASLSEARRLIRGGGARVDGVVVTDEGASLEYSEVVRSGGVRLSAGRKRHVRVTGF